MTGNEIVEKIETIFPDAQCELFHDSTFQLVVAVILSAQTTDASVNKVTPKLFEAYPDAQSLAKAEAADVEPYIRSIGLYRSKAKNIVSMARDLMARFDGVVPSTYKELQSLAGVGRKTANVVRSVAFDIPSFAVDTHVDRVSKRLGLAKFGDSVEKVEEKLKRKIDRDRWNQAHHDFIFFGRYFCTARNPKCEECPFQSFCKKEGLEAYKKSEKQRLSKKNEQAKPMANDSIGFFWLLAVAAAFRWRDWIDGCRIRCRGWLRIWCRRWFRVRRRGWLWIWCRRWFRIWRRGRVRRGRSGVA